MLIKNHDSLNLRQNKLTSNLSIYTLTSPNSFVTIVLTLIFLLINFLCKRHLPRLIIVFVIIWLLPCVKNLQVRCIKSNFSGVQFTGSPCAVFPKIYLIKTLNFEKSSHDLLWVWLKNQLFSHYASKLQLAVPCSCKPPHKNWTQWSSEV